MPSLMRFFDTPSATRFNNRLSHNDLRLIGSVVSLETRARLRYCRRKRRDRSVLSYDGVHGSGLRYSSSERSTIETYVPFGNPQGGLNRATELLEIEHELHQPNVDSLQDLEIEIDIDIDIPRNVPSADDVGAGTPR